MLNDVLDQHDFLIGDYPMPVKSSAFPIVQVPQKMLADIVFNRLKYVGEGLDERPDIIIHGVTGRIPPGTSCCILSGSSDKTANILLKVLSGRTESIGNVLGTLTVNDGPLCLQQHFNSDGSVNRNRIYPKRVNSVYIASGDAIFWPDMTVRVRHSSSILQFVKLKSIVISLFF